MARALLLYATLRRIVAVLYILAMGIVDVDLFTELETPADHRTLKELFPVGPDRPASILSFAHWHEEMEVIIYQSGKRIHRERIFFCDAGASRVVYVAKIIGLALKFSDVKYETDDNLEETQCALPKWLIPCVHGYFKKEVNGVGISVLLLDKMDFTIRDMGRKVPEASAMDTALREYAEVLSATWLLLLRAGLETNFKYGDWNTGNIMVNKKSSGTDWRPRCRRDECEINFPKIQ